jgi:glycine hydroxymethyltransferase
MGAEEMRRIGRCIGMTARDFEGTAAQVKAEVADICEKFPLYR